MASHTTEVMTKAPQGTKRASADDLEGEQRLTKRFDLMNLENRGGRLYIPVSGAGSASKTTATSKPRTQRSDPDFMQVEDTKDRVYVHDLDEELAEIESDEEHPIFLSDIEKHLHKIPKSVLIGDEERKNMAKMQMVLYRVPTSLSVPEAQDSVRMAIIEARQRARDNQALRIPDAPTGFRTTAVNATYSHSDSQADDPDAMEIG